jgi:hypothetical protein
MNSGWSIALYRTLMQAYPREFRSQYGEPVDQAFRDMHRDAFHQRGYLGVALLWFHILPDFLFSAGEVLLAKAGDFLKWRFRLQWVVACSAGFALARSIYLVLFVTLGREFFRSPQGSGFFSSVIQAAVGPAIFMTSLGLMQSRVLAGRCFRKKEWVLYGLTATMLATIIFEPLHGGRALTQLMQLLLNVDALRYGMLREALDRVIGGIPLVIFGAITGALQSAAIKNDAITRYRWMKASMAGYFLSAVAGGFVIPIDATTGSPFDSFLQLVLTSFVAGAILGLLTSGPLERILFSVQADAKEQS